MESREKEKRGKRGEGREGEAGAEDGCGVADDPQLAAPWMPLERGTAVSMLMAEVMDGESAQGDGCAHGCAVVGGRWYGK